MCTINHNINSSHVLTTGQFSSSTRTFCHIKLLTFVGFFNDRWGFGWWCVRSTVNAVTDEDIGATAAFFLAGCMFYSLVQLLHAMTHCTQHSSNDEHTHGSTSCDLTNTAHLSIARNAPRLHRNKSYLCFFSIAKL